VLGLVETFRVATTVATPMFKVAPDPFVSVLLPPKLSVTVIVPLLVTVVFTTNRGIFPVPLIVKPAVV